MQANFLNAIGILGAAVCLLAYASVQLGHLNGNGRTYTVLNTIGAALVLLSLSGDFNMASAIIQVSWLSIGCFSLLARRR